MRFVYSPAQRLRAGRLRHHYDSILMLQAGVTYSVFKFQRLPSEGWAFAPAFILPRLLRGKTYFRKASKDRAAYQRPFHFAHFFAIHLRLLTQRRQWSAFSPASDLARPPAPARSNSPSPWSVSGISFSGQSPAQPRNDTPDGGTVSGSFQVFVRLSA